MPRDLVKLDHFLMDMDGTIYLGKQPIPGAAAFIDFVRASGRGCLFFTNNSSADAEHYASKLTAMGMTAEPDQILTSGEATVRHILSATPYRRVFVVGTPSFEAEVARSGLTLDVKAPDVVVLAFDRTLTYAKLEEASHFLRAGLPYLATNPDKVCPTETGYIPDCGAIAALLFEATGRRPIVVGKPSTIMVDMALQKLGATNETTAMVGDRLYTDMQMAYDAGIASILVLSGETTPETLDQAARRPDFVFDSVRELHAALRRAAE